MALGDWVMGTGKLLKENSLIRRVEYLLAGALTGLALFGGAVLAAMALMTVVSVIGRELIWAGLGPIPGDFELVEVGAAVAVFSFLPLCQMQRGHVTVDILVSSFPNWAHNLATLAGDIAITAFAFVIAWRLWPGVWEKVSYNEVTMILGMPTWYGFALAMVGAAAFLVASAFTVWRDIHIMRSGERLS